jgi:hypothetical protein
MAPCRIQIVLALEVEAPWRPTNCAAGDTQAYPRDEHCQTKPMNRLTIEIKAR